MMKKLIIAMLCVCFLLPCSAALAKEVPLPEANTDAEILLPGFEWYCERLSGQQRKTGCQLT